MLSILRNEADAFGPDEIELQACSAGWSRPASRTSARTRPSARRSTSSAGSPPCARLRLARLARAAQPDGRRDRRGPDAQERWRELTPAQRTSFLALIGDETNRLATLIGDVLDTSRIEAGTFSYSFTDVDVAELVRDTVATAAIAQDEVGIVTNGAWSLPHIRGDRERLRQVLTNLVENAVKYSQSGGEVSVRSWSENGRVLVVGRGSRSRHPTRPAGPDLREVRPRPRRARETGHRARALHCALDRRGARRHAGGRSRRPVRARRSRSRSRSRSRQAPANAVTPSSLPERLRTLRDRAAELGGSSSSASPR